MQAAAEVYERRGKGLRCWAICSRTPIHHCKIDVLKLSRLCLFRLYSYLLGATSPLFLFRQVLSMSHSLHDPPPLLRYCNHLRAELAHITSVAPPPPPPISLYFQSHSSHNHLLSLPALFLSYHLFLSVPSALFPLSSAILHT